MATSSHPLIAFVERLRAREPVYDWQPVVEEQKFLERKLRTVDPPEIERAVGGIEEARAMIRREVRSYLDDPSPGRMLLVKASPGTGKTTIAAEIADELALDGKRIAYAGPRHDLYLDVVAKSSDPRRWYEWQPRQTGEDREQTCHYAEQINRWLSKGYAAMDFCRGVCGWDYIHSGCVFHAQARRPEPVIYVQHQHVTLGHPMQFDVLFGDESPLTAFVHEWDIPAKWVCPPGMDYAEPITEVLHALSALCEAPRPVQGPELIDELGGAAEVIAACEAYVMPAGQITAAGTIHQAEEVDEKPYFHLFDLVPLLLREARQTNAGAAYPHRIIAAAGHLTLLLRRNVDWARLPEHVIWMDATGRPEIYREIFGRPVAVVDARPKVHGSVYQVVDRANGKRYLSDRGKADQTKLMIRRIIECYGYERPSVIGFRDFVDGMDDVKTAHFYAARGTNAHEDADGLIVVGAPQPNIYDVVKLAKMIFFDRDAAFRVVWGAREVVYPHIDPKDGMGRAYPVSGFWIDPDLQTLVEVMREDEIVQNAHRARPVNKPVDIWLLTNVPVSSLPPTQLLTMREVLQAPEGVDIFKWGKVAELIDGREVVGVSDIENLGISRKTASGYIDRIAELPGWEKATRKNETGTSGGRPTKTARRTGFA